ncbi:MAG: NAD+ synthase [Deltaproteobacteria bacterium]|nr:NAD+ synthase [Deltaproteobacteria bacterium]
MKVCVAQINSTVGDFDGNVSKIIEKIQWAEKAGAELVIFPEMAVTGYPTRDLLEKPYFILKNLAAIDRIAKKCFSIGAIVGYVSINESSKGRGLFNSAAFLSNGKVAFVQHKALLPTYDVFDETRHFAHGLTHKAFTYKSVKIGITICEDIWSSVDIGGRKLYDYDPVAALASDGAEIIINISASPFYVGKGRIREALLRDTAKKHNLPVIYVNAVGGNDELIFDGRSLVMSATGEAVYEGKPFEEDVFVVDTNNLKAAKSRREASDIEELHDALILGLKDYARKCGFKNAVIGLSGGIDSSVVAYLAAEALGNKNVHGISMPSPYSSAGSIEDAKILAKNLGIGFQVVPISDVYKSYLKMLSGISDKEKAISVMEENIQARIRGNILMAFSNKTGALVLSTGNKSELAVGYCTLYGDMAGGLAIISDVPKTSVYELAKFINRKSEIIPQSSIIKAPSAELRPNQKDSDTLPPYEVLDKILKLYIEDYASARLIIDQGFNKKTVEDIVLRVDRNEYKRRQAPPGLKVTSKAFGAGRRHPIAWRF